MAYSVFANVHKKGVKEEKKWMYTKKEEKCKKK